MGLHTMISTTLVIAAVSELDRILTGSWGPWTTGFGSEGPRKATSPGARADASYRAAAPRRPFQSKSPGLCQRLEMSGCPTAVPLIVLRRSPPARRQQRPVSDTG